MAAHCEGGLNVEINECGIREPAPELGDAGETLKQAHSLALVLSCSTQCEDSTRDVAVLLLDLLERAHGELVERMDVTVRAVEAFHQKGV